MSIRHTAKVSGPAKHHDFARTNVWLSRRGEPCRTLLLLDPNAGCFFRTNDEDRGSAAPPGARRRFNPTGGNRERFFPGEATWQKYEKALTDYPDDWRIGTQAQGVFPYL